ncbi:MAG: hypothetical protein ACE5OR_14105 [bacterium]
MTVEQAIKTALGYETKVRDVYAEAVEHATDQVGKRIFQVLADEEQQHVKYLQNRLDEWKRTGMVTAVSLDTGIPSRETIANGVSKLKARMSDEDHGGELQMLRKALDVEIETSNFYKKMVSELPAEGQQMFARFVEIEEGHLAIVQAEIDYVSGTGFWFDFREFDLEAA